MNKTLLFGIIVFSSGVTLFAVFGSFLPAIYSEQPNAAPFPSNGVVTDSCLIEQDIGYLSLKVWFYEQGTTYKVAIPTHVQIKGPDSKVLHNWDYVGEINSFYGSKPSGTYSVTITNQEDQNNRITQGIPTINYDLVCRTKDAYNLGQSFSAIMVVGNLMYLVGFPVMIYGIIKERKIRKRQAIAAGYWKTQVQKQKSKRPLGVTALGIDSIIVAVLLYFGSLIFAGFASAEISSTSRQAFSDIVRETMPPVLVELDFRSLAGILLVMGIVSMIEGYGLLTGRRWAWTLTIVTCFISIAISVLFFSLELPIGNGDAIIDLVFGLGISGLIIYYLQRPPVRTYFGRTVKSHLK